MKGAPRAPTQYLHLNSAPPLRPPVELQLKPYHPNQRMKVPRHWKTGFCCQELMSLDTLFHANLAAVDASFQAKLGTVESTFGRCDKALSELQQQASAAAAALSSGHVPADGPSIEPFRARLNEMARADLVRDGALQDLDQKLVSLAYSQSDAGGRSRRDQFELRITARR